jgi:GAF domain-containing protein
MLLPEKKNSPGSNNVSTAPVSPESEIQRLEPLLELAAILSRQTDFDEVLRVITQKAAFLLEAEAAVTMMINPQTRHTIKTIFKEGEREDELKYQPVHKHVSGWVIKNGQPFMSADLKNDARFTKNYFENAPALERSSIWSCFSNIFFII